MRALLVLIYLFRWPVEEWCTNFAPNEEEMIEGKLVCFNLPESEKEFNFFGFV